MKTKKHDGMTKFSKLTEFFMGKAAARLTGWNFPGAMNFWDAIDIFRVEGQILRLRLEEVLGPRDTGWLAFAQDDSVFYLSLILSKKLL